MRWRALLAAATVVAFAGGTGATAFAVPGDTSNGTTTAHVQVGGSILLTGLTTNFNLNGSPGATVSLNGAVTMVVTTNNLAGYTVTVQAALATMLAVTSGNTESIPIGDLHVRETGVSAFTGISSAAPVTVHSQNTRSAPLGDAVSNDYQVDIPFVATDSYTAQLNYIATAS